jgi:hypothetical protein
MLNTLLMAALLFAGQESQQTGIIAGTVSAPKQEVSQTLQIILLSPRYVDLWTSEVQKRLDLYWQQYQPTFRNRKEFFSEFSKQAHKDATIYVLTRMGRDSSNNLSQYWMEISAGGRFEFKNVPFGEYKVLAIGRIGDQDVMWQEFVDVRNAIPHFLELKKRVP